MAIWHFNTSIATKQDSEGNEKRVGVFSFSGVKNNTFVIKYFYEAPFYDKMASEFISIHFV